MKTPLKKLRFLLGANQFFTLYSNLWDIGKMSPRRMELASISSDQSSQCPHLVDPNTGVSMKESTDIINYLYKNYSTCKSPS